MKVVVARLGLALIVAAWAGVAGAADKPAYGPPPAWVDVPPAPDIATAPDQPSLKMLFDDNQSRLSPEGDTFYNRRAIRRLGERQEYIRAPAYPSDKAG